MGASGSRRLGAYVLAADPTWLRSSISRYYDAVDVLVVSAAADATGWTGKPIRSAECVEAARALDARRIVTVEHGTWRDVQEPIRADTRQRRQALAAVGADVDWVLQIDTDELLPDLAALHRVLDEADRLDIDVVEWPMRVLYRRLPDGRYLQVTTRTGTPFYEYPGPIAVRPGVELIESRRATGRFLRPVVVGDTSSLQVARPAEEREVRLPLLHDPESIVHNSWGRSRAVVHAKLASSAHNQGLRSLRYYWATWLPTPLRWRRMRDFHPFAAGLWPRLAPTTAALDDLLVAGDR
ncbi:hypothetical protein [uncultured Jatrophihabitans sp.]|uniref:hypothetical protein n=1 Tax=uncultured Jatrophihabitans sp. TaxID=1610747 RepID=UPI0035CBEE7A